MRTQFVRGLLFMGRGNELIEKKIVFMDRSDLLSGYYPFAALQFEVSK